MAVISFGRKRLSCQCLEQCLGLLQGGGVKALGEPGVDRRQQVMRFAPLALLLPQPTQAHGGAQLQRLRLLAASEGAMPPTFRLMCISGPMASRMPRAYQVILLRPSGRGSGRQRASSRSPLRAGLYREPSAPHLLGISWPLRPTPLPHDYIGHQPFDVAVAEAEAEGEPDTMAHYLRRKPRALRRAGCGWWVQAASMPPQPGTGRWASS
jgi:hypothetical protein